MKAEIEKKTFITLNLDRYMINALFASWMDRYGHAYHITQTPSTQLG